MPEEQPAKLLLPFTDLLDASIKLYRDNAKLFFILAAVDAVGSIPFALWSVRAQGHAEYSAFSFLWVFILWLVATLASSAMIYAAAKTHDQPIPLLKAALSKLVPVIITGVLTGLIVAGGAILFLIPAIIFAVWFVFWQPIVLLEDKQFMAALNQSRHYVRGRWWGILGRFFLMGLLSVLASAVIGVPFGFFGEPGKLVGNILTTLLVTPVTTIFGYLLYCSAKDTYRPATDTPQS